jgi:hypothetical protein
MAMAMRSLLILVGAVVLAPDLYVWGSIFNFNELEILSGDCDIPGQTEHK